MITMSRDELLDILDREFLSRNEAAEELGITPRAFSSLVARGKIEQIYKDGAKLYLKQDIMQRKQEQMRLRKKFRPYDQQDPR